MEAFTYKGISDGKYVEGDIEALNLDEASHKLKEQKIKLNMQLGSSLMEVYMIIYQKIKKLQKKNTMMKSKNVKNY